MDTFRIKVTVKSATNKPCGKFKIGDSWIVEHGITPNGMCSGVYYSVAFAMEGMMKSPDKKVMEVACPDTKSIMIYEVRKMGNQKEKPN